MARRPTIRLDLVRQRWRRSSFHGALLGIGAVTAATAGIGLICALVALVVALTY